MGGNIWVVSQLGHGSVFHLEMPFQEVAKRATASEVSSEAGAVKTALISFVSR